MPKREMLINYVPGEECRIAIVEDGRLEELYAERASNESHVNNIYKGRVTNVEPGIQAAFVDFGLERNGFLHISDLHPKYFPKGQKEDTERVGKKTPHRERPPMQACLRRGQEVVVQVLKEGIGTKGPTVTTYLSIPGRFLVMMPDMERLGVTRKIDDDDRRRQMRQILSDLNPPDGYGFIVRTAGMDRTKTELKRDLAYLNRLAKAIDRRRKQVGKVGELYTESDLIIRTLRDVFSNDIERVIVDNPDAAKRAHDFLAIASPRSTSKVMVYSETAPLFHRFGIESQIESIHLRHVPLKSGGSLVIDSAEALVAIDVNSGKMRDKKDAESTALKTNIEACDEICRQLRLRDLGGVVVCDLIDMRQAKNRKRIEQQFRDNLKNDRARTKTLPISQFGILEMTRQRMRPSLKKATHADCRSCEGRGVVRSSESVVLDAMRLLALVIPHKNVARAEIIVSPDVAFQLLNRRRRQLVALETEHNKPVLVRVNEAGRLDAIELLVFDERGGSIDISSLATKGEPTLVPMASVANLDDDVDEDETAADDQPSGDTQDSAPKKKRRRRRRRSSGEDKSADNKSGDDRKPDDKQGDDSKRQEQQPQDKDPEPAKASSDTQDDGKDNGDGKKRRRRRRGGRRRRKRGGGGDGNDSSGGDASNDSGGSKTDDSPKPKPQEAAKQQEAKPSSGGFSNKLYDARKLADTDGGNNGGEESGNAKSGDTSDNGQDAQPKKKRSRRRRRSSKAGDANASDSSRQQQEEIAAT